MNNEIFLQLMGFGIALIGLTMAGWASLWWRMGKLETSINGKLKEGSEVKEEWERLQAGCPLLNPYAKNPHTEEVKGGE